MAVSAAAYPAMIADNPVAVSSAQQNDPAATPSPSARPAFRPRLMDVPMTASTFGPGLATASRKAAYAVAMPGSQAVSMGRILTVSARGYWIDMLESFGDAQTMKDGPDIARITALIGDPARANMLMALMSGFH